jgi:superfamily II DNA or RNA helicase
MEVRTAYPNRTRGRRTGPKFPKEDWEEEIMEEEKRRERVVKRNNGEKMKENEFAREENWEEEIKAEEERRRMALYSLKQKEA